MNRGAIGLTKTPQGLLGIVLIAVFWPLNWMLPGNPTAYLFFPLWLGYILLVDALVRRRSGTSLLTRSPRHFVLLFVLSAPAWWLFEVINWRTQNWEYIGSAVFSDLEYILLCSVSFSTVMPAVFETAELARTFPWMERFASGARIRTTAPLCVGSLIGGLTMLGLVLTWPKHCYPLVWVSIFMVLEPINVWLGRRNFLQTLQHGDWRPVMSLSLAALICGFFWEMWNYFSSPKWIYHTPGAEFLRVFEMPLLGYGGYLPFAWELYALRNLFWPGGQAFKV
jgi:hypothetical protein